MGYEITPSFEKQPTWECYSKELAVEYRQSVEEGKDIEAFKELFSEVTSLPDGKYKDNIADVLFELVTQSPQRADYKYIEPSDLGRIRQFTKPYDLPMSLPDDDILLDKILGGWLGRVCGCFLGKPVEGIMEPELRVSAGKNRGGHPHRRADSVSPGDRKLPDAPVHRQGGMHRGSHGRTELEHRRLRLSPGLRKDALR